MSTQPKSSERVTREVYPTASFTIFARHLAHIAKRAADLGISKSEFMRSLIERDIREQERDTA